MLIYLDAPLMFSGRTFGRPFKKMAAALIPLVFQMGAAATWAVVAALVGIKTLGVALIILKLLLVAGAAKVKSWFAILVSVFLKGPKCRYGRSLLTSSLGEVNC